MKSAALWLLVSIGTAFGQTTFEVSTVKPSARTIGYYVNGENGQFDAGGMSLKGLVALAFGVLDGQVEGGPDWAGAQRWDIQARANTTQRLSGTAFTEPFQKLLQERFKLRVQSELRQNSVFFIDIEKSGLKMKSSSESGRPSLGGGNGMIGSNNATVALLATFLSRTLGRPVIDRTGLTGGYEMHFTWTPEVGQIDATLPTRPPDGVQLDQRSLFAALTEELGLKLSGGKQDSPFITILSAELPDAN